MSADPPTPVALKSPEGFHPGRRIHRWVAATWSATAPVIARDQLSWATELAQLRGDYHIVTVTISSGFCCHGSMMKSSIRSLATVQVFCRDQGVMPGKIGSVGLEIKLSQGSTDHGTQKPLVFCCFFVHTVIPHPTKVNVFSDENDHPGYLWVPLFRSSQLSDPFIFAGVMEIILTHFSKIIFLT